MRFSLRMLAAALVAVTLLAPTAWAQRAPLPLKEVRLDQVAQDTQRTHMGDDTMELVWVIPPVYWHVSAAQQQNLSDADRKQFVAQLDDYLLVAMVRGKVGMAGIDAFADGDVLFADMRFVDAAGTVHAPMASSSIPAPLKNLLSILRPVMANMLGPMGDNMHFAVLNARDAKSKPLFDPAADGRVQVRTSLDTYTFRTPLGSLLPPRQDAATGESFPGDYLFNPYTGGALQDAAPSR
ncbi:hypothetical protein [uncultured Pseudoxanthomonas sp.]|uniref:hypothetical protein n=1 Tax=uncultured Pseudoxanthomonas sp. TaxID=281701 RepID=UPI002611ED03|nr:hypothetical protein [uncultured Pseudoxanthomonas sp.]